jgi:hypothetical protein
VPAERFVPTERFVTVAQTDCADVHVNCNLEQFRACRDYLPEVMYPQILKNCEVSFLNQGAEAGLFTALDADTVAWAGQYPEKWPCTKLRTIYENTCDESGMCIPGETLTVIKWAGGQMTCDELASKYEDIDHCDGGKNVNSGIDVDPDNHCKYFSNNIAVCKQKENSCKAEASWINHRNHDLDTRTCVESNIWPTDLTSQCPAACVPGKCEVKTEWDVDYCVDKISGLCTGVREEIVTEVKLNNDDDCTRTVGSVENTASCSPLICMDELQTMFRKVNDYIETIKDDTDNLDHESPLIAYRKAVKELDTAEELARQQLIKFEYAVAEADKYEDNLLITTAGVANQALLRILQSKKRQKCRANAEISALTLAAQNNCMDTLSAKFLADGLSEERTALVEKLKGHELGKAWKAWVGQLKEIVRKQGAEVCEMGEWTEQKCDGTVANVTETREGNCVDEKNKAMRTTRVLTCPKRPACELSEWTSTCERCKGTRFRHIVNAAPKNLYEIPDCSGKDLMEETYDCCAECEHSQVEWGPWNETDAQCGDTVTRSGTGECSGETQSRKYVETCDFEVKCDNIKKVFIYDTTDGQGFKFTKDRNGDNGYEETSFTNANLTAAFTDPVTPLALKCEAGVDCTLSNWTATLSHIDSPNVICRNTADVDRWGENSTLNYTKSNQFCTLGSGIWVTKSYTAPDFEFEGLNAKYQKLTAPTPYALRTGSCGATGESCDCEKLNDWFDSKSRASREMYVVVASENKFFEECRWVIEKFDSANILLLAGDDDKANKLYDVFESSKILPRDSTKNHVAETMCEPRYDCDLCAGETNDITIGDDNDADDDDSGDNTDADNTDADDDDADDLTEAGLAAAKDAAKAAFMEFGYSEDDWNDLFN